MWENQIGYRVNVCMAPLNEPPTCHRPSITAICLSRAAAGDALVALVGVPAWCGAGHVTPLSLKAN